MAERNDIGAGEPLVPAWGAPAATGERRTAAEQAGPASWTDRVPDPGTAGASGGAGRESGAQGVAHKAAEKASALAHDAGERVQEAVNRKKDETADRLAAVANAVREAARSLQAQDPGGLSRYADSAARQIERASGYLRGRDLRGLAREAEKLARRRPELFLAGSVLAGLALARLLKSSSRRPHDAGGEASGDTGFEYPAAEYASVEYDSPRPEPAAYTAPERGGPGEI